MTERIIDIDAHTQVSLDLPDTAKVDASIVALHRELDVLHGEFSEVLNRVREVEVQAGKCNANVKTLKEVAEAMTGLLASLNTRLYRQNNYIHNTLDANQARHERQIGDLHKHIAEMVEWVRRGFR